MTEWYNEHIDPAGYGYGGYGEWPYGGEETEWSNISDQSTAWTNETITGTATWSNVL